MENILHDNNTLFSEVTDTRLYKRLCPPVRSLVCWSVIIQLVSMKKTQIRPCPPKTLIAFVTSKTFCHKVFCCSVVQQGRIHGHQLRTGGQGRKCAFSNFSTRSLRTNGPTDRPTYGPTDGQSLLKITLTFEDWITLAFAFLECWDKENIPMTRTAVTVDGRLGRSSNSIAACNSMSPSDRPISPTNSPTS